MPSLIPKTRTPDIEIDLEQIFTGDSTAATRTRVISALGWVYGKYSDRSREERLRPNVITEEFYISMPTQAAYAAEIALCEAILSHSSGAISDENIKTVIKEFIDAHLLVHQNGSYEAKTGQFLDWTGKTLPLFYISSGLAFGMTGNMIQIELAKALEKAAGKERDYQIRAL